MKDKKERKNYKFTEFCRKKTHKMKTINKKKNVQGRKKRWHESIRKE